jgi:hypothetical protein
MIDDFQNEHPVVRDLLDHVRAFRGRCHTKVQEAVLKHGRAFTGIERPKGYRQHAVKKCFTNSASVADGERGFYVEGFALTPIGGTAVHHGWVTLLPLRISRVTIGHAGSFLFRRISAGWKGRLVTIPRSPHPRQEFHFQRKSYGSIRGK